MHALIGRLAILHISNLFVQKEEGGCCWAKSMVRANNYRSQNCIQAVIGRRGGLGHINKHNSESSALPTTSRRVPVTEIKKDSPGKIGELGKSPACGVELVFYNLAENGHFFGV
jgi:hypothetical protein